MSAVDQEEITNWATIIDIKRGIQMKILNPKISKGTVHNEWLEKIAEIKERKCCNTFHLWHIFETLKQKKFHETVLSWKSTDLKNLELSPGKQGANIMGNQRELTWYINAHNTGKYILIKPDLLIIREIEKTGWKQRDPHHYDSTSYHLLLNFATQQANVKTTLLTFNCSTNKIKEINIPCPDDDLKIFVPFTILEQLNECTGPKQITKADDEKIKWAKQYLL